MATKDKTKEKLTKKMKPRKSKVTKKAALKKAAVKAKTTFKKTTRAKKASSPKKRVHGKSGAVGSVMFEPVGLGARSGGQSGDLQGLSNRGRASSESVDELLEEGNAFEAEIVKGVEDAGDADEGEVRTHEVPEDDVPGEYSDKD